MPNIAELSFEQAYAELENVLEQLSESALSLQDSVALFERGKLLTKHCQSLLDAAELRISQITDSGDVKPL
jgi:exodeoxyribonuclease VII small subunit